MFTVYALSLDGVGFRYVGLTTYGSDAGPRLYMHRFNAAAGIDYPVYRWMRKHGPENVQATVLCYTATVDDLKLAEIWWIAELRKLGYDLLNCTIGGDGVIGVPIPEQTRKAVAAANSQRVWSDESRAKMSAARVGNKTNLGRTPWNKGKSDYLSDEARARIGAASSKNNKGHTHNNGRVPWNKGKKMSS
jgi:hypothetical protein